MSDLAPHTGSTVPVPAGGDHRYKAVQTKLRRLGRALDSLADDLEVLRRDMRTNAARARSTATDIENADLDPKFVVLTDQVADALGAAANSVKDLGDSAREVATETYQAKRLHAKLYRTLDDIRSNRSEKTPKPAFFTR
ncbi:conjugal transfer protein TraB [Streptomyces sp. NPDC056255]|uniref:conjugal transfer protein TraB n=1 Tax=Streptomyces sp. NPDC056255 TaxID=3345764 RepID=UPI0035D8A069